MFILECLNNSPFPAGQAPDSKEVCLRTGCMPQNGPDSRALLHRQTVAAGLVPLLRNTPADAAHTAAIGEFHPFGTTSHAIDGRGRNLRSTVHHAPFPGGLLPQPVVIEQRGPAGIALPAIQAAACNQLVIHSPSVHTENGPSSTRPPAHSENHSGIKCSGRPSEFFFSFDRISNRSYSVHAGVAIV